MMFTHQDYQELLINSFHRHWPGFKPDIIEAPHGDGRVDAHKRYAHVNPRYLNEALNAKLPSYAHVRRLTDYWLTAFGHAQRVHRLLGLPHTLRPGRDSTLRVLHYPPGVGGEEHTDFDMFTLLCYRNPRAGLVMHAPPITLPQNSRATYSVLESECPGLHLGELYTKVTGQAATPHRVKPLPDAQHSVVFFAVPDHSAKLPGGITVGDWINERKERSRVKKSA